MAPFRNISIALTVVVILITIEKMIFDESSSHALQEHNEGQILSHSRLKRNVPPNKWKYSVDIVMHVPTMETYNILRSFLDVTTLPLMLNTNTSIIEVIETTECTSSSNHSQCTCRDQFVFPHDVCVANGACDNSSTGVCQCINSIPADGPFCLPLDELLFYREQSVELQLTVTDNKIVEKIRNILMLANYSLILSPSVNVTHINITTVCSPDSDGFQCVCEDEYRWPCEDCQLYKSCYEIINSTCGCISRIPPEGPFCQSVYGHNFTECSSTTTPPTTDSSTMETTTTLQTTTTPNTTTDSSTMETTTTLQITITPNTTTDSSTVETTTTLQTTTTPNTTTDSSTMETTTTLQTTTTPNTTTDSSTVETTTTLQTTTTPNTTTDSSTVETTTTLQTTTTPNTTTDSSTVETTTTLQTTTTPNTTTDSSTMETTTTLQTTTTPNTTTDSSTVETTTTLKTTTTPSTTPNTTKPSTLETTTTSPITKTTVSTAAPPVQNVMLSVTLELNFTDDLEKPESPEYKKLETDINLVLSITYRSISGFVAVFVTGFRSGSVIADFILTSTGFTVEEFRNANENLPTGLRDIARVIGSVVAQYESPTKIPQPNVTLTGRNMELTCGPPDVDVGNISSSEWKFNNLTIPEVTGGRKKITLNFNTSQSSLLVTNVISLDTGDYECILKGDALDFVQTGNVPTGKIKAAPSLRLQNSINTRCIVGQPVPLECCVQTFYSIDWFSDGTRLDKELTDEPGCIRSEAPAADTCDESEEKSFICKVRDYPDFKATTRVNFFTEDFDCEDEVYGQGRLDDISSGMCSPGQEGRKTAVCQETGWELVEDTCILTVVNELLILSQELSSDEVPDFAQTLSDTVLNVTEEISQSPATIDALVQILNIITSAVNGITENVTQDVLLTIDAIIGDNSKESWDFLNANETQNTSSRLLNSLETISEIAVGQFEFETDRVLFVRKNSSSMENLNSSVFLNIPQSDVLNIITIILLPTLDNVMPPRNSTFNGSSFDSSGNEMEQAADAINAAVVVISVNQSVTNVTLRYKKLNNSLVADTQCVFWNFGLLNSIGAWDNEGCEFVSDINDTVTCTCNHLTSFSILMATGIPESIGALLDGITYAGVAISMASLVICLIIEGYVWKDITRNSTAFMRHVSIINTALSLLIANICFIIGAAIADNPLENPGEDFIVPVNPCSTATFFMHFFYLAVFFWMLVSALLLFYRTVRVFSHMSKSTMVAIGITLGYVCPLLIAVITVAVTAPGGGYIRKDLACWLNWFQTKALLAMVIPALTIVFINFLILIVVLFKMLRRGVGDASNSDEKHTLVVIIRCVAILTPLFGLTWGLGVGTMISSTNTGIHIAFAFFNSLQGFFVLVFGILLDSKIRALLAKKIPALSTSSHQTQSTGVGSSSSSGFNFIDRFRRNRNIYHVSNAANSSSGASESFVNS